MSDLPRTSLRELSTGRRPVIFSGGTIKDLRATGGMGARSIYTEVDVNSPIFTSISADGTHNRWQVDTEIIVRKQSGSSTVSHGWASISEHGTQRIGPQEVMGGEKTEINKEEDQISVTLTPTREVRIKHPFIYNVGEPAFFVGEVTEKEDPQHGKIKEVVCVAPGTQRLLGDLTVHWSGTLVTIYADGSFVAETGDILTTKDGIHVLKQDYTTTKGAATEIPLYEGEERAPSQKYLALQLISHDTKAKEAIPASFPAPAIPLSRLTKRQEIPMRIKKA